jgi:hypothetical protein
MSDIQSAIIMPDVEYIELPDLLVDFKLPSGLDLPRELVELLSQYTQYEEEEEPVHNPYKVRTSVRLEIILKDYVHKLNELELLLDEARMLEQKYAYEERPEYLNYIAYCFVYAIEGKRLALLSLITPPEN